MNWRGGLTRAWLVGVAVCVTLQFVNTNVPGASVAIIDHYPTKAELDQAQASYDAAVRANAHAPAAQQRKAVPKDPILEQDWPITRDVAEAKLWHFALAGVAMPLLLPPALAAAIYLLLFVMRWVADGFTEKRRRRR
jgi:hypothetical protein